jgi:endogenous inhibitor of DNA gyrase (YacG/DUF329 family)
MFENDVIDIPCPGCGKKIRKKIGQLPSHGTVKERCAGCGAEVTIDGQKFRAGIKGVEKQLDDFKRDLGKLFK